MSKQSTYSPSALSVTIVTIIMIATVSAMAQNPHPSADSQPFDIIIRNGHILDGSGGPWFADDIGIRGERIVAIGNLTGAQAKHVIDATGRIVSPGFIDMLGQSEFPLLIDSSRNQQTGAGHHYGNYGRRRFHRSTG